MPPFGVPVSAPSAGPPSFLTVTGPDDADEHRAAEPTPEERSGDEQYRIVAAAGPDPLERERARTHDVEADAPEPEAPAEPETVAPEEPAPVDLDPETTAERIAALWRTPPPDEILSDEHPISSWAETSLGVSFGPGAEDPLAGPTPAGPSVDPDAATGEFPAVAGPATPASGVDVPATNGVDLPGANGEARVRRARHSRSETGEFEAPVVDTPPSPTPPARTNGHHHGSERPDASGDAVTGPVQRPAGAPGAPSTSHPAGDPHPAVGRGSGGLLRARLGRLPALRPRTGAARPPARGAGVPRASRGRRARPADGPPRGAPAGFRGRHGTPAAAHGPAPGTGPPAGATAARARGEQRAPSRQRSRSAPSPGSRRRGRGVAGRLRSSRRRGDGPTSLLRRAVVPFPRLGCLG